MTDEEKKERRKANYEKNKEKNKATMKVYNEKNKEKLKANNKANYEKNKEKLKANYEKNKEKLKANNKAYRDKPENKASNKAYRDKPETKARIKEYKQTPEGIKSKKISSWKKASKIISDDWDATYEWFMNTKNCQKCDVLLENGRGSKGKCLDHDHSITDGPNTRAVLCNYCNIHEGKKRHASKEECDKHYKEKIKCVCGSNVSRKYMKEHEKTSKHINFHINLNA